MQVTKLCYYVCPLGPDLWGENISCMVQMIKAPKNCSFFNIYRFFNWQKQWLRGLLCEWWRQWKQWTESQCYWLRRDGWLKMHRGMPQVRILGCYLINQLEKLEAAKAAWLVYLSLLGPSWPYWALLSLTGPYWALLGLTGPYLVLLSLT